MTAEQCPRISAEFLASERAALPRGVYQQEYECAFVEASGSLFDGGDLAAMFGDDEAPPIVEDGG